MSLFQYFIISATHKSIGIRISYSYKSYIHVSFNITSKKSIPLTCRRQQELSLP